MRYEGQGSLVFNDCGRIIDDEIYQAAKSSYCEVCGAPCDCGPHHIKSRGAGGSDAEENLIQLCFNCHRKVHDGKLDDDWLRRIVERRIQRNKSGLFGALLD